MLLIELKSKREYKEMVWRWLVVGVASVVRKLPLVNEH